MSATITRTSPMMRSDGADTVDIATAVSAEADASLGIRPGVAFGDGSGPESRGIEQREVHRRSALGQPLGHEASRRRRMLKPVTAEAHGQEEALDTRSPPDDRVIVGCQRPQS